MIAVLIKKIGVTEWTLSNGVKVVVKPTDFEKNAVMIRGRAPGGEAVASDAEFASVRFANQLAGVGGFGDLDAPALRDLLVGKDAQVSTSIGESEQQIDARGAARDRIRS
jgi:zinc protease